MRNLKIKHDWAKLPQWAQRDLEDMMDSGQTAFVRCSKCHRMHDDGYICPFCGHDESHTGEERG